MTPAPFNILLVEDSPGDVALVKQALKKGQVANSVHVAEDGVAAMTYLRNRGQDANSPLPDLVLLDINLPKMNGHEVLREIREDPKLRSLPVVVLTTSDQRLDIEKAYEQHANAYVTKPFGGTEFIDAVKSIESFWLTVAKLPGKH